jgi:hypothetical protein
MGNRRQVVTIALPCALLAGVACGSRSGLELPLVPPDGDTTDALLPSDGGGQDASDATIAESGPDAPGAADAPDAPDAPDSPDVTDASDAAPRVCTVDPNSPGAVYWALQAGGFPPNDDGQGYAVPAGAAVDPDGNLVVAGWFYGTMQLGNVTLTSTPLVVPGYPQLSHASSYDVFVAKFNPVGKVLFAKAFGDGGQQFAVGLALDPSGNIFVAGEFASTISFGGSTATLSTGLPANNESAIQAFLAKLDPEGNAIFSLAFGQTDYTVEAGRYVHGAHATSLSVDGAGDVVLTGYYGGSIDFTGTSGGSGPISSVGEFNPYENGLSQPGGDGFLAKFTNAGGYVFGKSFGVKGAVQQPAQVAVGTDGSIVVAGSVQGSIDIAGRGGSGGASVLSSPTICPAGAAQPSTAFLAKLDSSGTFVWGQTFPANGLSQVFRLATDPDGHVVMTGSFNGSSDLVDSGYVTDAALPGPDGSFDCVRALGVRPWTTFLVRLDADGGRSWVQGTGQRFTNTSPLTVDDEGGIYLGGGTQAPPVAGAAQYFATLSKLDEQGRVVWSRVYGTTGGSFFTTMAIDQCSAELFGGGTFGSYPSGSSLSFPSVDGVTIDVFDDGGNSFAPPIDMFLGRLVP